MGTSMLGYSRVSTEEQADSHAGLDAQEHAIRDEAKRRGWDVTMVSDPGKSGKFVNPQLRKALERLATGQADGLVVAKMDRLARSVVHAVDIIDLAKTQGWSLVVLDLGVDLTTPAGRAMAMTMAVFAELERELVSQRTKDGMAARKRAGVHIGRPRLAPPSVRQRIVQERETGTSYAKIARTLTDEGVLSPEGRPTWQPSTVRRIYNSVADARAAQATHEQKAS
jgi:DNA invertase Pin-like site-specific DNA recombinase